VSEVLFYHLEKARLESVLPEWLEKTVERGWRALVRCGDRACVERLDEVLWTWREESFLAHSADPSLAGVDPVHLTDDPEAHNGADLLFLVEGARAKPESFGAYKRCVIIFNGADETELSEARSLWKQVKAQGAAATYWKQSAQGRWEKQA